MSRWSILLLIVMMLAAACGGQQEEIVLPTRVDLDALATVQALTAQPTATPTRSGPTLPPTWTATPSPTMTPTNPASLPTPTPEGFIESGIIFYIYNGDSIVRMNGDGSNSQLIATFGVGRTISDLTLSQDGTLLAFVGPGSGSAREVYAANLDGTYIQQVSCLGFSDVRRPRWSPDGAQLAFIAAQSETTPPGLYVANLAGSGNCPQDNNQRLVYAARGFSLRDILWDIDSSRIFFSDDTIFLLDLTSGARSPALTQTLGFGADFNLAFDPQDPGTLTYLRAVRDPRTDLTGGSLFQIEVWDTSQLPIPEQISAPLAESYQWNWDGSFMLVSTRTSIALYERRLGATRSLVPNLQIHPAAIFSPDGEMIAFVGVDPANAQLQQVFVTRRRDIRPVAITNHSEGTVSDLIWRRG